MQMSQNVLIPRLHVSGPLAIGQYRSKSPYRTSVVLRFTECTLGGALKGVASPRRDPSNSCRLVLQEVREMVAPVLKSFQAQVSESHDLLFLCS